jgi:glycosyltransferase involved in cell wall biosynthesis
MPDATIGWVRYAVDEGRRLLEAKAFDAILSSSGPPSSHLVAAKLQKISGLPWIADFRDLWSDNHWDRRIAPFTYLERGLERRTLNGAHAITTVAPTWADRLARLHEVPVHVVYNGFDPGDYPSRRSQDAFTLNYAGTLIRPGQNPEPLFLALAELGRRLDLDHFGFQVRFVGTAPGAVEPLAHRCGVSRWVRLASPVSYRESLALQVDSTANLFVGWDDPAEGWVSAKLFEYVGAGRPILSVGPPGGDASRILEECGLPDLTDDPQRIADTLESWLGRFADESEVGLAPDPEAASRYTRRAQTERLATLLEGTLKRNQ